MVEDLETGIAGKIASTPQTTEKILVLSESKTYQDGSPQNFINIVMDFDWDHVIETFKKGKAVCFRAINAGIEPTMYLFY